MLIVNEIKYKEVIFKFLTIKEHFIIFNNNENKIELITTDNNKVINFILKDKDPFTIKDYNKVIMYGLLEGLTKNTTKYRTIKKYTIIKYDYYISLFNEFAVDNKPIKNNSFFKYYFKIKDKPEFVQLARKLKLQQLKNNIEKQNEQRIK